MFLMGVMPADLERKRFGEEYMADVLGTEERVYKLHTVSTLELLLIYMENTRDVHGSGSCHAGSCHANLKSDGSSRVK